MLTVYICLILHPIQVLCTDMHGMYFQRQVIFFIDIFFIIHELV